MPLNQERKPNQTMDFGSMDLDETKYFGLSN